MSKRSKVTKFQVLFVLAVLVVHAAMTAFIKFGMNPPGGSWAFSAVAALLPTMFIVAGIAGLFEIANSIEEEFVRGKTDKSAPPSAAPSGKEQT